MADAVGRLYVCATPIGNLSDASQHLREVLASVAVIACEDTRHSRTLLTALGVSAPRLVAHHAHNERDSAQGLVQLLRAGDDVALISDAGTPGIADPGGVAVRAAHDAGIEVIAVPGPSAVAAALSVSGAAQDAYSFVGFLPRSASQLRTLLTDHAQDVVVALESPARIMASLEVVADEQPQRRVAISRELTKVHEQTLTGSAREVVERVREQGCRGEIVLVLDPIAKPAQGTDIDPNLVLLVEQLAQEGMRMKDACRVVARWSEQRQKQLYDAVIARQNSQ